MATMAMPSVNEQYSYIDKLAADYNDLSNTDSTLKKFLLDRGETSSPKQEFTRLAVHHYGWVGGGDLWKSHWKLCFGEEYPYGRKTTSYAMKTSANTA